MVATGGPATGVYAAFNGVVLYATTTEIRYCADPTCSPSSVYEPNQPNAHDLASDGAVLFWLAANEVRVCTIGPGCGGAFRTLGVTTGEAHLVLASDGKPVWADATGIWFCTSPSSSMCGQLLTADAGSPRGIAAQDCNTVWTDGANGLVLGVGRGSCDAGVITIARGQSSPRAIAIDKNYVYWSTASEIRAVAR